VSSEAKLTQGPIAGHLVRQTLPMIVGIVCIIGVGLVDAYFIGMLGPDPLAAVSFLFPVTTALASLGVGVMVGINSVISRALGADDVDKAKARSAQGVLFAFVAGVVIAGAMFLGSDALFTLMNASEDLRPLIAAYVLPYAAGFPFLLVAMGANGVLRGQGEAIKSSAILITVALVNAILDPLLIFGIGPFPELGIAGAGYAVAIAYVVSAVFGLWMLGRGELRFDMSRCRTVSSTLNGMREIGRVGAPAALANAINPAGLAVLTAFLATHGDTVVAGFGAASRLQAFAVVPLLAMSSSIGPIVGQNWGAGEAGRARATLRLAGLVCVVYGAAVAVPLVLFRREIGGIFTEDPAVIDSIARYLLIASAGFFAYGLLVVSNGAMNAIDVSGRALGISAARVLLVMVPLAWVGSRALGPSGVFGAELAANLVGGCLAFWLAWRAMTVVERKTVSVAA